MDSKKFCTAYVLLTECVSDTYPLTSIGKVNALLHDADSVLVSGHGNKVPRDEVVDKLIEVGILVEQTIKNYLVAYQANIFVLLLLKAVQRRIKNGS